VRDRLGFRLSLITSSLLAECKYHQDLEAVADRFSVLVCVCERNLLLLSDYVSSVDGTQPICPVVYR
jgi:hypothetical protein